MQDIFRKMEKLRPEIPEEEQKEMVVRIIDVLKDSHLTYNQAHSILELTRSTLDEMSHSLLM